MTARWWAAWHPLMDKAIAGRARASSLLLA